jgi:hypothetical protein
MTNVFRKDFLTHHNRDHANNFPTLKHPREREHNYPIQPRFALGDNRWPADLDFVVGMFNAGEIHDALMWVRNNGYSLKFAQVPEAKRAAAIALAKQLSPHNDGVTWS